MELLRYAFTGINILPSALFILLILYWISVILGAFDFEFFEFDIDADAGDGGGILSFLAVFLKIGGVPIALVMSIIIINFWILSMLLYMLPIPAGGLINTVLLLPALIVALGITKVEIIPLRHIFKNGIERNGIRFKVMDKRCRLLTDLEGDRLGQAEIKQESGASIIINVKLQFHNESFKKGEVALVFRKDAKKDVYYIARPTYKVDYV